MGIAALCLAQAHPVALLSTSGILGVTSLYLSVRLAHSSLMNKLNARAAHFRSQAHASEDEDERKTSVDHESEEKEEESHSDSEDYAEKENIISSKDNRL